VTQRDEAFDFLCRGSKAGPIPQMLRGTRVELWIARGQRKKEQ
jgi:hypothetical protein